MDKELEEIKDLLENTDWNRDDFTPSDVAEWGLVLFSAINHLRQEKLELEAEIKRLNDVAFKRWSEIQKLEAELEKRDE